MNKTSNNKKDQIIKITTNIEHKINRKLSTTLSLPPFLPPFLTQSLNHSFTHSLTCGYDINGNAEGLTQRPQSKLVAPRPQPRHACKICLPFLVAFCENNKNRNRNRSIL